MRLLIVLILIFNSIFINAEQLSNYSIVQVKTISTGAKEGQIGWQSRIAGRSSGPRAFVVTNTKIFVPDRVNYRLNVYDLNFNFLKTIIEKEDKKVHFTLVMKADNNENIIYLTSGSGLKKIDNNGNSLLRIGYDSLPRSVQKQYNFFPIADTIFIYNDENKVECITNEGKFLEDDEIRLVIKKIENEWKIKSQSNSMELTPDKEKIIEELQRNNSFLIINKNFYSTRFSKNREYFEKIKDIREFIKLEKLKIHGEEKKEININLDDYDYSLFGYDEEHNGYWGAGKQEDRDTRNSAIIVISKYGEVLDAFYFGQYYKNKPNLELYPTSGAEIAVAPSGDVYFLVGSKEKYTLYKVERCW